MKTYARPKAMFRKEKAKKDNDEDKCSDSFEEQAYILQLCAKQACNACPLLVLGVADCCSIWPWGKK